MQTRHRGGAKETNVKAVFYARHNVTSKRPVRMSRQQFAPPWAEQRGSGLAVVDGCWRRIILTLLSLGVAVVWLSHTGFRGDWHRMSSMRGGSGRVC